MLSRVVCGDEIVEVEVVVVVKGKRRDSNSSSNLAKSRFRNPICFSGYVSGMSASGDST